MFMLLNLLLPYNLFFSLETVQPKVFCL